MPAGTLKNRKFDRFGSLTELTSQPWYQRSHREDKLAALGGFFDARIAPVVPDNHRREAWRFLLEQAGMPSPNPPAPAPGLGALASSRTNRTAPKSLRQAAPAQKPTPRSVFHRDYSAYQSWEQIRHEPWYSELNERERQAALSGFFRDVAGPSVAPRYRDKAWRFLQEKAELMPPQPGLGSYAYNLYTQPARGLGQAAGNLLRGAGSAFDPDHRALDYYQQMKDLATDSPWYTFDWVDELSLNNPFAPQGLYAAIYRANHPNGANLAAMSPAQRKQTLLQAARARALQADVTDNPVYQLGQNLAQLVKQEIPSAPKLKESFWATTVPRMVGQTGLIAVASLLPGTKGTVASLATGSLMMRGHTFAEALKASGSFAKAYEASQLAGLVGLSEALPILRLLDRVNVNGVLTRKFLDVIQTGSEEAIQEFFQTTAQNLIAQGYYDPERGVFSGVGQAAAGGFTVGALLQTLAHLIAGRRTAAGDEAEPEAQTEAESEAPTEPAAAPEPEAPEVAPTETDAEAALKRLADDASLTAVHAQALIDAGLAKRSKTGTLTLLPKGKRRLAEQRRQAPEPSEPETQDGLPGWQLTRAEFYSDPDNAGEDHREIIEQAIEQRQPVPAHVLLDYPELVQAFIDERTRVGADTQATQAEPAPSEPEPQAEVAPQAESRAPAEALSVKDIPVTRASVTALTVSQDVPQFKAGADDAGVVEPLQGPFDTTGMPPIQVWQRRDGRLEVISGRHRLALARQEGVESVPVQIHKETAGFSAVDAALLDAKLNIRENQGTINDYAVFFRHSEVTLEEAQSEGLLGRRESKGRKGWQLAQSATDELLSANSAGVITDEAALRIAEAAPGNERLQLVGLDALQNGATIADAVNTMKAVAALAPEAPSKTGDLFGLDASGIEQAKAMARIASRQQRAIRESLAAVQGAVKRPQKARELGVDVNDPEAVQARIDELKAQLERWQHWHTDPELMAEIRAALGERAPAGAEPAAESASQVDAFSDAPGDRSQNLPPDERPQNFTLTSDQLSEADQQAEADAATSAAQNDFLGGQSEAAQQNAEADKKRREANAPPADEGLFGDAEQPATPQPQIERRKDFAQRKRVAEMSSEEMRRALLVDDLTGLGNRRAYEEAEKLPVQVSIDADSLKWINDHMSPQTGDELLAAIGEAIGSATDNGYHISGDEFIVQAETHEEAEAALEQIEEALKGYSLQALTPNDEILTKTGLEVTYGIGADKAQADHRLKQEKQRREESGERAPRGEPPPGVAQKPAQGEPAESDQEQVEAQGQAGGQSPPPDEVARRYGRTSPNKRHPRFWKTEALVDEIKAIAAKADIDQAPEGSDAVKIMAVLSDRLGEARMEALNDELDAIRPETPSPNGGNDVREPSPLPRGPRDPSVSEPAGRRPRRPAAVVPGQLSLFTPEDSPVAVEKLARKTKAEQVGTLPSAIATANSPEEIAQIVADLARSPQEKVYAVVTDAKGDVLTVIQHTMGGQDRSAVFHHVLASHIAAVEGAEKVWLAHNHPSGEPAQSLADANVTAQLHEIMRGTGVESQGMVVVAPDAQMIGQGGGIATATFYAPGGLPGGEYIGYLDARASQTGYQIPITERRFSEYGALGAAVTSPQAALEVLQNTVGDETGVLLLDNHHNPVGFVPMTVEQMRTLRTGDRATGAGKLLQAIANTNANAMIVKVGEVREEMPAVSNMQAFAKTLGDMRLLDVVYKDGGKLVSMQTAFGRLPSSPETFFMAAEPKAAASPDYNTNDFVTTHSARIAELNQRLGAHGWSATAARPKGQGRGLKARRLAKFVKDIYGREVVWFKSSDRQAPQGVTIQGQPERIYVNVGARFPMERIAGHEMIHAIRQTDPAAYDALTDSVLQLTREQPHYARRLRDNYQKFGLKQLSKADLTEEFVADVVGAHWAEPGFMRELAAATEPSTFKRIANAILAWLDKIAAKLKGHKPSEFLDRHRDNATALRRAILHGLKQAKRDGTLTVEANDHALVKAMVAYHGSPHDFDEFSLQKIGTGEGHQAFAWGLYFSSSKAIAQYYKTRLSKKIKYKGRVYDFGPNGKYADYDPNSLAGGIAALLASDGDAALAKSARLARPEQIDRVDYNKIIPLGKLYQVNIAPESDQFLDYDKPISRQPSGVFDKLVNTGALTRLGLRPTWRSWDGADVLFEMQDRLGMRPWEVSEYLNSIGIPGVKYRAGQLSGVDSDEYNYVLFDDSLVSVEAKFSLADETPTSKPMDTVFDTTGRVVANKGQASVTANPLTREEADALKALSGVFRAPTRGPETTGYQGWFVHAPHKIARRLPRDDPRRAILERAHKRETVELSRIFDAASNNKLVHGVVLPGSEPTPTTPSDEPLFARNVPIEQGVDRADATRIYRAHSGESPQGRIRAFSSWTTELDTAQAYTDNPGFGGPAIRSAYVGLSDVLNVGDIHSLSGKRSLAEALGYDDPEDVAQQWHDAGYRYPWEEVSEVEQRLKRSGYRWLRYEDDFPEGADTLVPLQDVALTPGETTYSRGGQGGPGATALESVLAETLKKARRHIPVIVTDADPAATYGPRNFGVEGVYDQGQITLFARNINSPKRALEVLRHEAVGHFSMERMLGDEFDRLLKRLRNSHDAHPIAAYVEEVKRRYPELDPQSGTFQQELIAAMAEAHVQIPLMRRIRDLVQRFLQRLGLLPDTLTPTELNSLIARAGRELFTSGRVPTVTASRATFAARAPTFYSEMGRVLAEKLPGKATPAQYQQAIQAFTKKGQIKQEELEWSGILQWLDEQSGKVAKADLMVAFTERTVRTEETFLGFRVPEGYRLDMPRKAEGLYRVFFPDGTSMTMNTLENAQFIIRDTVANEDPDNATMPPPTQYEEYALPGGEDYSELLIQLPRDLSDFSEVPYQAPHFTDHKNILAHLRLDTRDDGQTLFLQEIQSDLHQTGRKEGYRAQAHQWRVMNNVTDTAVGDYTSEERAQEIARSGQYLYVMAVPASGPMDAPFKTTWPLLALKRAIRLASDNGMSRVAWTTGEQQVDRYALGESEAEGMRHFYDTMLPNVANKYLKKWGVRVGKSLIDTPDGPIEVHSFELTPDLHEAAQAGQPLFSRKKDRPPKIRTKDMPIREQRKYIRLVTRDAQGRITGAGKVENGEWTVITTTNDLLGYGIMKARTRAEAERILGPGVQIETQMVDLEQYPLGKNRLDLPQRGFVANAATTFQYLAQDRMNSFTTVQGAAEAEHGPLDEKMNTYMMEAIHSGRARHRLDAFERDHITPLLELLKKSGLELDASRDTLHALGLEGEVADRFGAMPLAEVYLYARHAPEANAALEKINPNEWDLSGMSDAHAEQILTALKSSRYAETLAEVGERVDEITRLTREKLVEGGLEKASTVHHWAELYPHYVPLKSDPTAEAESSRRGPKGQAFDFSKRRFGRHSPAEHLLPNLLTAHQTAIMRAEKNRVGQALLRFAQHHPDPELWAINQPQKKRKLDPVTDTVRVYYDPNPPKAENVFVVRVGGVEHHIEFNTANTDAMRMAEAMNQMSGVENNIAVRAGMMINRFLSLATTGWNPEFWIVNFARDLQTAAINLNETEAHNLKRRIVGDVIKGRAWRAIRRYQKDLPETVYSRYYREFLEDGGETGWGQGYEAPAELAENLTQQIKALKPGTWAFAKQQGANVLEFVAAQNARIEDGIRLSAYMHARKAGVSRDKAAFLAKELTVNFNRKGVYGDGLNALYLFYNAAIQGNARIIGAAMRSKKVRRWMGAVVALGLLQELANHWLAGEDDDGRNRYETIPEYVKRMNWIIMLGHGEPAPSWVPDWALSENGDYIKIPMPYGYNMLNYMGQKIGKAFLASQGAIDNYSIAQEASSFGIGMLSSFNPVGYAASWYQIAMPTIGDPFAQWQTNESWAGVPIHPEPNPFDPTPPPHFMLYFSDAREWSKWIAKQLNFATGGTEIRPGGINIYPELIDHFSNFAMGGAGRFILDVANLPFAVQDALSGENELSAYEIPFLGEVYGTPRSHQSANLFYKRRGELLYVRDALEAARMAGNQAKVREIRREKAAQVRLLDALERTYDRLGDIRQRIDAIKANERLSPARQRELIEQAERRMERQYNQFNQLYDRLMFERESA